MRNKGTDQMSRRKPAETRAEVIRLRRTGTSYRDIAKRVGVSDASARAWVKADDAVPATVEATEPTEAPPAAELDLTPLPPDADALARAKHLYDKYVGMATAAERDGNHTAAGRMMRDAGGQALLIARLEKGAAAESDVVKMSRPEIEQAIASVKERLQVLAAVPFTCSECGRAVRVRAVKGE